MTKPPEDIPSCEAIDLLRKALTKPKVRLMVEANLDPVPGWGDNPEDWRALVQRLLDDAVPHYHPTVEVQPVEVQP